MMTGLNWDDDNNQGGLLNSRSARRCLSDQEVEDFLFDRLSGTTREAVEEHLLACADCLKKVEAEEEYVRTVRAAARTLESEELERAYRGPEEPAVKKPARTWPHWGIALGVTGVVLTAIIVEYRPVKGLTEAQIALRVERNTVEESPEAAAGQPLRLTPDLTALGEPTSLEWAVVDAGEVRAGHPGYQSTGRAEGGRLLGPDPEAGRRTAARILTAGALRLRRRGG
jgi:hypothetical protein